MKRRDLLRAILSATITTTFAAIGLCAAPTSAAAQGLTGYQVRVYLSGATAPTTTYDIPLSAVVCGQQKQSVNGPVTNPTILLWDDPANPALDCLWIDQGNGPIFALPFSLTNTYAARLVAVNLAGQSPESAPSNPFSRPGQVLGAPGNVRLYRP